jgi:FeS assembly SUF system protein
MSDHHQESAADSQGEPRPAEEIERLVVDVLKDTFDPEIPVNIYDLGMIYDVEVGPDRSVAIRMTLTSPACPVAESLPGEVESRVRQIPGIGKVTIDLVWEPPWDRDMMSMAARLTLGM